MGTKLERILQLSKEKPEMVLTSIGHFINKELLKECHGKMDGNKAVGIDGVTKEEYGRNLEKNFDRLVERLKKKSYRPQPAKRVEIPKDNGKTRPLSIYCYEDKLVQEALRRLLEAVFEPHFYDEMMGFRPNLSCHMALRRLNVKLTENFLREHGIRYDHIIFGAPYGERILVNDDKPGGLKTGIAVNVSRNQAFNIDLQIDPAL